MNLIRSNRLGKWNEPCGRSHTRFPSRSPQMWSIGNRTPLAFWARIGPKIRDLRYKARPKPYRVPTELRRRLIGRERERENLQSEEQREIKREAFRGPQL